MNSHVITESRKSGTIKTKNLKATFIQATRDTDVRDPTRRRAAPIPPPKVICAVGQAQQWDEGGGLDSGSSLNRRFLFQASSDHNFPEFA